MSGFMKMARKRGADMTQALLYAAFAIIVLISVLAMYQVVSLSNNKTETARIMSLVSQEIHLMAKAGAASARTYESREPISDAALIARGALPSSVIKDGQITLPYGGLVSLADTGLGMVGASEEGIYVQVIWQGARNGKALCTYLSSGSEGMNQPLIEAGPLGTNYRVANMCNLSIGGVSANYLIAVYEPS